MSDAIFNPWYAFFIPPLFEFFSFPFFLFFYFSFSTQYGVFFLPSFSFICAPSAAASHETALGVAWDVIETHAVGASRRATIGQKLNLGIVCDKYTVLAPGPRCAQIQGTRYIICGTLYVVNGL